MRAGEDDLGARRLQPDDRPAPCRVQAPVTLDLSIDLWPVQDRSLDDIRIVAGQAVLHSSEVRHGAAHCHNCGRSCPPVEARQVSRDGRHRLRDDVG